MCTNFAGQDDESLGKEASLDDVIDLDNLDDELGQVARAKVGAWWEVLAPQGRWPVGRNGLPLT